MKTKTATLNFQSLASLSLALALIAALMVTPGSTRGFASLSSDQGLQSFIVQGSDVNGVVRLVEQFGGAVISRLDIIHGVSATLSPEAASRLRAEPGITAVTLNSRVTAVGDGDDNDKEEGGQGKKSPTTDYADVVGADTLWQQGVTGQGVTVAVVDTGLGRHKGLMRDVNGKKGRIVGWADFIEGKKNPRDPNGHGTHVGGIIANSQKGEDGEWNGVAPGVNLVGVRVLDETGAGTYDTVIQGLQWVIAHKDEYNIRVVNLSLVSPVQSPYWADPLNQAVMQVWASGIVVVVAAGNGGPDPLSIGVPGNNPYVITVGAFTDNYTPEDWSDDYLAPFSSAGPTLDGFAKPDVVAPGAHMVSTMLPKSYIAKNHLAHQVTNQYFSMAGTSQASAVVAGIAALIQSRNPGLTPDQVKYRIIVTALPWIDPTTTDASYSMWQQGAGRVNAPDAVMDDTQESANSEMDILADLAGEAHYEGFSYYDEATGQFRLRGDFNAFDSTYGVWDGKYGIWAGKYGVWAGKYGVWAGKYGVWAGNDVWAGKYGVWAGKYGVWAGKYGVWAGGYTTWAGKYGVWAGAFGDPNFVASFTNPASTGAYGIWAGSRDFVGAWVEGW